MTIRNNIPALFAHRNYLIHLSLASKAMQRLSSGYRINSAADDAAGLAISEKMRSQIRGLKMASLNAQHGVSMLQTAEGGLNETHAILIRMRELTVQAANGTYSDDDRALLNKEYQVLKNEIDRISSYTNYNGIKLLDGSAGGKKGEDAVQKLGLATGSITSMGNYTADGRLVINKTDDGTGFNITYKSGDKSVSQTVTASGNVTFDLGDSNSLTLNIANISQLKEGAISNIEINSSTVNLKNSTTATTQDKMILQVGANGGADQQIGFVMGDLSTASLGEDFLLQDTDILTVANANKALKVVTTSAKQVSSARADIGAQINRLGFTINNLDNTAENLQAAESSIRDVDMAEEMMVFMRHNILMQASQAMMAQAMQSPNIILMMLNAM